MKKTMIFYAAIIVVLLAYFFFPRYSSEEKERFEQYKEDFVLITEYISDELSYIENTAISVIWDEKTHEFLSLYCEKDIYVPENIMMAFDRIKEAFYSDFSFVDIAPERISFGGLGSEMYVLSLDKKTPDYFYDSSDGVEMTVYSVGDNWYYLHTFAR